MGVAEFPLLPGALDYKLCPLTPVLLGCVCGGEVWVLDSVTAHKHQLTSVTGEHIILVPSAQVFIYSMGAKCAIIGSVFKIQHRFIHLCWILNTEPHYGTFGTP